MAYAEYCKNKSRNNRKQNTPDKIHWRLSFGSEEFGVDRFQAASDVWGVDLEKENTQTWNRTDHNKALRPCIGEWWTSAPQCTTLTMSQETSSVMNYFEGNISANNVTDRTPAYEGTAQDALREIVNTKSVDGHIDHSSLRTLARATLKRVDKTNRQIFKYTDPTDKVAEKERYDINIVEEEGRSLGGMITVLTEAVKGLNEKVEALQAENQTLKAEIAALKAQ